MAHQSASKDVTEHSHLLFTGEMCTSYTPRLLCRELLCSVNIWMDSRRAEHRLRHLVSPSRHGKISRCRKAYAATLEITLE